METRRLSRRARLVLLGVLLLGLEGLGFIALNSGERIEAAAQWATETGDCLCRVVGICTVGTCMTPARSDCQPLVSECLRLP